MQGSQLTADRDSLLAEIRRLEAAYPSAKMDATLFALHKEQARLANSLRFPAFTQLCHSSFPPPAPAPGPDGSPLDLFSVASDHSSEATTLLNGMPGLHMNSALSAPFELDQLSGLDFPGFEGVEADWLASL